MKEPKTIVGGIAVAFQTRRIELLHMELRRLRAECPPSPAEYENVLNALEMATTELWQMQDAVRALNGLLDDIQGGLGGLRSLTEIASALGAAAHAGEDLPLDPDGLRAHFKKKQREGQTG